MEQRDHTGSLTFKSVIPNVNYIVQGSGKPVILIHGMAASLHDWTYLAPELAARGFAVYALDLPGHGDSLKPEDPNQYHVEQIYRHLRDWLEALALPEPPTLVGHSLGGYLSLMHAIRQPSAVLRLVLIDPFYEMSQLSMLMRLMSRQPAWSERAVRIAPQWLVDAVIGWHPDLRTGTSPEIRRQMAADYQRASPHFTYIPHHAPDLNSSLGQVRAPTLVVWGEGDLTLPPASFPRLVGRIATATGCAIPGAGHNPHLSQPGRVNRLILEFLERRP